MSSLCNFSTAYCVAICAFLIPANLLATFWTLWLVGHNRPVHQVKQGITLAGLLATAMSLHVFSWIAIGVVMAPTYILLGLASVCLSLNAWAVFHPVSLRSQVVAILGVVRGLVGYRATRTIEQAVVEVRVLD
jgi:hypothetical protein